MPPLKQFPHIKGLDGQAFKGLAVPSNHHEAIKKIEALQGIVSGLQARIDYKKGVGVADKQWHQWSEDLRIKQHQIAILKIWLRESYPEKYRPIKKKYSNPEIGKLTRELKWLRLTIAEVALAIVELLNTTLIIASKNSISPKVKSKMDECRTKIEKLKNLPDFSQEV